MLSQHRRLKRKPKRKLFLVLSRHGVALPNPTHIFIVYKNPTGGTKQNHLAKTSQIKGYNSRCPRPNLMLAEKRGRGSSPLFINKPCIHTDFFNNKPIYAAISPPSSSHLPSDTAQTSSDYLNLESTDTVGRPTRHQNKTKTKCVSVEALDKVHPRRRDCNTFDKETAGLHAPRKLFSRVFNRRGIRSFMVLACRFGPAVEILNG